MKNKEKERFQYLVGIDEVGRGPLAGPVAVGAVVIKLNSKNEIRNSKQILNFKFKNFKLPKCIKDSKKLSEKKREEWLGGIKELKEKGDLDYYVSFVGNKKIDERGIVHCIRLAIKNSLKKLKINPMKTIVLLDGGLKAPEEFTHQRTIIKGDEKEPIISLASIAAKVARDRKMATCSKKFPQYGFDIHKGYGTALHCLKIRENGLSELHRKSFCKKFANLAG